MSALVWVMMGIAVWHFTVFVPDRFWGGIVGAFLGAVLGAFIIAFIANGLHVPGRHDTEIIQAFYALPVLWAALHLRSPAVVLVTTAALLTDGITLFLLLTAPVTGMMLARANMPERSWPSLFGMSACTWIRPL